MVDKKSDALLTNRQLRLRLFFITLYKS